MRSSHVLAAVTFVLFLACDAPATPARPSPPAPMSSATPDHVTTAPSRAAAIRYVALGDSYTIGTGVGREERWPDQLVARLGSGGVAIDLVSNLGANGYTSRDLIEVELPQVASLQPELVTLLIGVNDVVQGVPPATYRANVGQILGALLQLVPRERIIVVSTPDYTRTPRGADFGDPEAQRADIAEVNRIMREEASERGIAFVDVGPVADEADSNPNLVASDHLHPSGAQYRLWVDLIAPVLTGMLAEPAE